MRWLRDCVNCGKQVILDGPDVKCYWCGGSATEKVEGVEPLQKEEAMVTEDERAKFEAMSNREKNRWMKPRLPEIVADIRSKQKKEVLKAWPFSPSTYRKLMREHTPELIGVKPGGRPKKVKEEESVTSKEGDLTEHEHLLILVGYQMGVREVLSRAKGEWDGTS